MTLFLAAHASAPSAPSSKGTQRLEILQESMNAFQAHCFMPTALAQHESPKGEPRDMHRKLGCCLCISPRISQDNAQHCESQSAISREKAQSAIVTVLCRSLIVQMRGSVHFKHKQRCRCVCTWEAGLQLEPFGPSCLPPFWL